MAKKKLLRFLALVLFGFSLIGGLFESQRMAMAEDKLTEEEKAKYKVWALELRAQQQKAVKNKITQTYEEAMTTEQKRGKTPFVSKEWKAGKVRPNLQIFVSFGMPDELLQSYAQEARQYDGSLVLCGLPNGSIQELTKKIMRLFTENQQASIQIDDNSFSQFAIKAVPSIVLSNSDDYFASNSEVVIYDKMSGNVSIKHALEQFSERGELQEKAKLVLLGEVEDEV